MSDDILDRLRAVGGRTYKDRIRRNEERNEAANEIERLRALITAWADADDACNGRRLLDVHSRPERKLLEAIIALRETIKR